MHILLCTDDSETEGFLRVSFNTAGHLVSSAGADDIVKKLEDGDFDLILLDVVISGVDGLDLLKEIRTIQSKQLVVMLSSIDVREEEAMELVFDLKRRLDEGASIAALAKEYSDAPSGKTGGSLGVVTKGSLGKGLEDLEAAVFSLTEKGQISDPGS